MQITIVASKNPVSSNLLARLAITALEDRSCECREFSVAPVVMKSVIKLSTKRIAISGSKFSTTHGGKLSCWSSLYPTKLHMSSIRVESRLDPRSDNKLKLFGAPC